MSKDLSKLHSSQEHWVCLACTEEAPVCFHAVLTSFERDLIHVVLNVLIFEQGRSKCMLFQSI